VAAYGSEEIPGWQSLNESSESLDLLLQWWLPSLQSETAPAAAAALRNWIAHELMIRGATVEWLLSEKKHEAEDIRALPRHLRTLESDDAFITTVALRLAGYDPNERERSPYVALQSAVDAELEMRLGDPYRAMRAAAAGPHRNRRSLGNEIRRRLALPPTHPARRELEAVFPALTAEEREFVTTAYGEGGYKELQRKNWSGRKTTAIRKSVVQRLQAHIHDLTGFDPEEPSGR